MKSQNPSEIKIADRNEAATNVNLKTTTAEQSEYFGYDNQIKKICVNEAIPSGLPSKQGYADKSLYKKAINEWFKAHNVFVKPEFQNTLIQD
ncbi:MAG: hypothetical protein IPM51_13685 [Sphingobacteriaceae bacterium]|nr:hypothetical protein [Sphingobacteriaceae bacterium]